MGKEQQENLSRLVGPDEPKSETIRQPLAILPRPVRILNVEPFKIKVLWNTREIRENDFTGEMAEWRQDSYLSRVADWENFKGIAIVGRVFGWPDVLDETGQPIGMDAYRCYIESKLSETLDPQKEVAEIIQSERKKAGLSQVELAKRTGYSMQYISKIERGVTDVQFGTLQWILRAGFGKSLVVQ